MFFSFILLLFSSLNLYSSISFITDRERSDLEITRFIKALDSTYTVHGKQALEKLLEPTNNFETIKKRQSILQLLLNDTDLFDKLETWLSKIKSCEPHISSYLERKQDLISLQAEPLYFQQLFEGDFFKKVADFCNKSSLILEGSILRQLFYSFSPIIFQLGAAGVAFKYNQWLFKESDHFEYWEGIKLGLEKPIKNHSWTPYTTKEKIESHDTGRASQLLYAHSALNGSLRDLFEVLKDGVNVSINFYKDWSLPFGHPPAPRPLAFLMALSVTAFSDIMQGFSIVSAWKYFAGQYGTIQVLKKQLYYLKLYFNHAHDLSNILHTTDNAHLIQTIITPLSPANKGRLKELESYLSRGTFDSPDGHFYRRGFVLWLHKKMSQYTTVTHHYVQQVGIIDAYMSIARHIKKLQAQGLPVCFASFTEKPNVCHIENGWILTTPDLCVQNSIELGDQSARAIILSGPHGCGKSTILTLLGHAAISTHSIGIGFASNITISKLQGIRTSFATNSDSEQGLSTFMAAQQSMQQIEQFMESITPDQTAMILLSEIYKGTIEAEAAHRMILFLSEYFLKNPTIIMGLESHVYAPILFAKKFPETFANKQMTINILDNGNFERTFLIADGAADWWFDNNELRSQYVDWINDLVRNKMK